MTFDPETPICHELIEELGDPLSADDHDWTVVDFEIDHERAEEKEEHMEEET